MKNHRHLLPRSNAPILRIFSSSRWQRHIVLHDVKEIAVATLAHFRYSPGNATFLMRYCMQAHDSDHQIVNGEQYVAL